VWPSNDASVWLYLRCRGWPIHPWCSCRQPHQAPGRLSTLAARPPGWRKVIPRRRLPTRLRFLQAPHPANTLHPVTRLRRPTSDHLQRRVRPLPRRSCRRATLRADRHLGRRATPRSPRRLMRRARLARVCRQARLRCRARSTAAPIQRPSAPVEHWRRRCVICAPRFGAVRPAGRIVQRRRPPPLRRRVRWRLHLRLALLRRVRLPILVLRPTRPLHPAPPPRPRCRRVTPRIPALRRRLPPRAIRRLPRHRRIPPRQAHRPIPPLIRVPRRPGRHRAWPCLAAPRWPLPPHRHPAAW